MDKKNPRIFLGYQSHPSSNDINNPCWIDRDFSQALGELGCNIIKFDWELPYSVNERDQVLSKTLNEKNNRLLDEIKKNNKKKKIDIFLSAYDRRWVKAETIEKIKELGIFTINYNCDDINAFDRIEELVQIYDLNWTNQLGAIKKYKKKNARYFYTPFGANPNIYRKYRLKKEFDVTFVGRNMGYREELIQFLVDEGMEVRVWGIKWPHTIIQLARNFIYTAKITKGHYLKKQIKNSLWYLENFDISKKIFSPSLSYEDLIKMYSRSTINLNFSGGLDEKMYDFKNANKSMKLRDIEATMSGAFYLTEWSKEIEKLFKVGYEIDCYKNKNELLEKCKYYLEKPKKAKAIGEAGRNRALKDYTWVKHFKTLFKEIDL